MTQDDVAKKVYEEINRRADKLIDDVRVFIEHVYNGGDPTKMVTEAGEFVSWWHHDASPYAPTIVNAYREEKGVVPNPYHPSSTQFRLFDALLAGWVGAMFGIHRTTATIKPHEAAKHGYKYENSTIDGRKKYRLVKITEEA